MISTLDLSELPNPQKLKLLMQSLAVLDTIATLDTLYPEDWLCTYSFVSRWSGNTSLASMQDGSGNHYFCLFDEQGVILKGFDHESPMSPFRLEPPKLWSGIIEDIPSNFSGFLSEPAFSLLETTFCIWRLHVEDNWQRGQKIPLLNSTLPDGSGALLQLLDGIPMSWQAWAEEYFERTFELSAIVDIYRHEPLTNELLEKITQRVPMETVKREIAEIEY